MLERRLQILLDEDRHRRVTALAAERGVSVAAVVREAIDRGLPSSDRARRAAAAVLRAAPDMEVPEPAAALREELEQLRGRHG